MRKVILFFMVIVFVFAVICMVVRPDIAFADRTITYHPDGSYTVQEYDRELSPPIYYSAPVERSYRTDTVSPIVVGAGILGAGILASAIIGGHHYRHAPIYRHHRHYRRFR